jgi:predicted amidohydrolase YtcJ
MKTVVLFNGPIYTLDSEQPVARALAFREGRITAVGTEGRVRAMAGSNCELINLQGRAVVPGLTDAHVHIVFQGLAAQEVQLGGSRDRSEAVARVADHSRQLPEGAWLRGSGWNQADWEGQWPSRADLDAVCPDRPVILARKDGHSLWVNSRALALAGIDAATADPVGGQIQRDPEGEPTGILLENAMELVRAVVPSPTPSERYAALVAAQREALSYGLTSLHVPPGLKPEDGREILHDLQRLRASGDLQLRYLAHMSAADLEAAISLGLQSGFGDDWLRIGGLKLFADGTLGSESADMLRHYEGRRHSGIATIAPDALNAIVARANAAGIAVVVHAIGDAAGRKVLDAIEKGRRIRPSGGTLALPNRIEHAQVLHQRDIPRFAELGVLASMQPIHATSDMHVADELWGDRCAYAYAWRSLLESGATLAFGSDAPVETINPWLGVHAAVTRQTPNGYPREGWYPQQRLSVEEALHAYCVGPALASGEADRKGRLRVGMLADLAVLTGDLFRSAPEELHAITAAMTIVGGNIVFER